MSAYLRTVLVAGLLVGTAGDAAAGLGFGSPITETDRLNAIASLRDEATQMGLSPEDLNRVLGMMLVPYLTDSGCPGVDVDVLNDTDVTQWNVAVSIKQELHGEAKTTVVHVPYLAAHTKVRITESCVSDYGYGSSYSASGGISVGLNAEGTGSLNASVVSAMAGTTEDLGGSSYAYVPRPGSRDLLTAAPATSSSATSGRSLSSCPSSPPSPRPPSPAS